MQHTVVTMSRGDAHKIEEWLEHHARLGFGDFQVALDGDVDGTGELLRRLDGRLPGGARVTVHPFAEVGEYFDGLAPGERRERVNAWREEHAADLASGRMRGIDPLAWRQHQHVSRLMAPYAAGERGRGWLGFIDVDEFVVLDGPADVGELTGAATRPRLRLSSFNVDTSGHDPSRPVLEQHTMRWSREDLVANPDPRWARRVKSLVRYRCAVLDHTVHKISHGPHELADWRAARLHHFKVPVSQEIAIPYSVDDPVRSRG